MFYAVPITRISNHSCLTAKISRCITISGDFVSVWSRGRFIDQAAQVSLDKQIRITKQLRLEMHAEEALVCLSLYALARPVQVS